MKRLSRKGKKFKGKTVGLDLHKQFIQYQIFDKDGDDLEGGRFPADRDGLRIFVKKLGKRVQFCMEACGCFYWVYDFLCEQFDAKHVHVAQPNKIKAIANSQEKNDANDAWWLGYLLYDQRLPESFVPTDALRELRIASRELRSVTDNRSDLIRRFKAHLLQCGLKILSSKFNIEKGRQDALALIKKVQGIRQTALKRLLNRIEQMDPEVAFWREEINRISEKFQDIKILKEQPGIGEILAAVIYSELGDPRKYGKAKAYAKASGLTPTDRSTSGKTIHGGMSRAGSRQGRWALTRAIIACLACKHGPGVAVKTWVNRKRKRKPFKKVLVAAARKFAEAIWRLFNLGEAFDLKKVFV